MRARCCNFAKSAAIFKKHDEARFSMSVTSRLSVRGGVENIMREGGRSASRAWARLAGRRRGDDRSAVCHTTGSCAQPADRLDNCSGGAELRSGRNSDPVETSLRAKRSNPRRVLCKPIKLSTSAPIAP
jgi:hypothetical protein